METEEIKKLNHVINRVQHNQSIIMNQLIKLNEKHTRDPEQLMGVVEICKLCNWKSKRTFDKYKHEMPVFLLHNRIVAKRGDIIRYINLKIKPLK